MACNLHGLRTLILQPAHQNCNYGDSFSALSQLTSLTQFEYYRVHDPLKKYRTALVPDQQAQLATLLRSLPKLQHLSLDSVPPGPLADAFPHLTSATLLILKSFLPDWRHDLILPCVKILSLPPGITLSALACIRAPHLQAVQFIYRASRGGKELQRFELDLSGATGKLEVDCSKDGKDGILANGKEGVHNALARGTLPNSRLIQTLSHLSLKGKLGVADAVGVLSAVGQAWGGKYL
jgi:hypothetical protein